jgi:hypothetical protein
MIRKSPRGSVIVEFSLLLIVWVALILGTAGIGINMITGLQTIQLARDAGHMFARSVDFSTPGNQTVLTTIGADLGLTTNQTTSKAVVWLTAVTYIDKDTCVAAGLADASGNPQGCTNFKKWAFTKRLVIGNPNLRASNFGNPGVTPDSTGGISLRDSAANAGNVVQFTGINPYAKAVDGSVSGLPSGQYVYIGEAAATGFALPPFTSGAPSYSFALF